MRLTAMRQALILLALFSGITVIAWGSTYWLVSLETMRAVDDRLTARMALAQDAVNAGEALPIVGVGQTIELSQGNLSEGFLAVDTEKAVGPDFRYLVRNTPQGQLVIGENVERQEELLELLAHGLRLSLAVSLVTTIGAGLWIARGSQARLSLINDGLGRVGSGDLSARISLGGSDDLRLIADRIDATTGRLEKVMTQMRVQSSNIA
ncbi:MAG: methyl-accepting chemotaxis protein, partial [Pseudomonadota bacterium]